MYHYWLQSGKKCFCSNRSLCPCISICPVHSQPFKWSILVWFTCSCMTLGELASLSSPTINQATVLRWFYLLFEFSCFFAVTGNCVLCIFAYAQWKSNVKMNTMLHIPLQVKCWQLTTRLTGQLYLDSMRQANEMLVSFIGSSHKNKWDDFVHVRRHCLAKSTTSTGWNCWSTVWNKNV